MKAKIVCLVTSIVLLVLITGSVAYSVWWGKESIEAKVCENQKFTLRQLDILAATATGLVNTSNANRTADETEVYIKKFQTMRNEIKQRVSELESDYC